MKRERKTNDLITHDEVLYNIILQDHHATLTLRVLYNCGHITSGRSRSGGRASLYFLKFF